DAALFQVQHDVAHTLSGAVIGVLAATPRLVDRQPMRVEEIAGLRAAAGGVEGRVLQQPQAFLGRSRPDRADPGFHRGACRGVGHKLRGPMERNRALRGVGLRAWRALIHAPKYAEKPWDTRLPAVCCKRRDDLVSTGLFPRRAGL